MDNDSLTPKCAAFLDALRALCDAHGITISSSGYDALQVWDADAISGPLHFNGIEDRTTHNAAAVQPSERLPLTDEQIVEILKGADSTEKGRWAVALAFARAIEAAHGIKK